MITGFHLPPMTDKAWVSGHSGFGYLTAKGAAAKGHTVYAGMRYTENRNAEKPKNSTQ